MAEPPAEKRRKLYDGADKKDKQAIVVLSKPGSGRRRNCPYLDTINRNVLDFDFEKLCSVSLSKINVYACLVCGKYFQGRGTNTHAYTHSVQVSHHVFLNLQTLRFYCLPDNYEIVDSSLDDITYVLRPTFTKGDIIRLDLSDRLSRAYDGTTYLPGIVGLNNIKANDYCNVVLQASAAGLAALSHVPPLRNYFLREENYAALKRPPGDITSLIVQRFGELIRKLWNPRNFKAHVSPHEMLQAVVLCSKKRFQITEQGDPIDFLSWFLNSLHLALNGTQKRSSSIVYKTFRGGMNIYSRKVVPVEHTEAERRAALRTAEYQEKVENTGFMYLTADLPAQPLFKDELRENIIPQVPLFTILSKFNGTSEKEYRTYKDSTLKRFQLTSLPPYLILYIKRFTKNTFFVEKNPTIVNFPIKDVDLGELVAGAEGDDTYVYDLIANVVHEGEPGSGKGTYRAHLLHRGSGKWYEMQDLHVTEILPQMITLSEAYIQIWERRRKGAARGVDI
ncbi:ubiquitin specific peptidase, putative [Ixodes scapularis]|uniref:Ubiquitin carboxyl-terminal hydrolase 39 n=1 Tax=Ixodes scapularis TaxID=6945 RepID=B7P8E0_IXOSC|nr:ubiquitin specific peptidase, putative [Ixodes scapularis]|eukprot:XP_002401865.1 ubiquitin specific peptidase, putative [Ixodes scapularis]